MVSTISKKTLGVVVLCFAVAMPALAGSSANANTTRTQRMTTAQAAAKEARIQTQVRRVALVNAIEFDAFLAANPDVAAAITKNPNLVDSKSYLAANKALQAWLMAHPKAAKELAKYPGRFLKEAALVRAAEAFENFLTANPDIASLLRSNPNLINSKAFMAKYAVLDMWLKANPDVAKYLNVDAKLFLKLTAAVHVYDTQTSKS
jgi:hypothetical protein